MHGKAEGQHVIVYRPDDPVPQSAWYLRTVDTTRHVCILEEETRYTDASMAIFLMLVVL